MYSFMGGGLFCAGVGNILLIVSTATDYWMQYRHSNNYMHQGLWRYCMPGKCFTHTDSIGEIYGPTERKEFWLDIWFFLMEVNINIYWLHQMCIWFCVLKLLWFPRSLYFSLVLAVMTFDLLRCVHVYVYSILGCNASIHDPVSVGLLHWHHHRCYGLHPLLILWQVW